MQKIKNLLSGRRGIVIVLVIIVILGFLGWRIFGAGEQQPQYQTAKVEKGTIVSSVSASGNVLSTNFMGVTTSASGLVKKVYVADRDKVSKGQKIAEITLDQQGQKNYTQVWSSYLSAKNNVDSANATLYTLDSQKWAANQKFINDAVARNLTTDDPTYIQENDDWLAAEAKYKNQLAVIEQAKASLNSAQVSYQLSSPIITAPISGTVNGISLVEGMVLSSQTSTQDSQTSTTTLRVAVIQGEAKTIITVNLTEIDVPKVKVGQKATVTFDSLSDKTFTGKVVTVDRIGTTSNNVTSYSTNIQLDTTSNEILPNMAANTSIILETKSDILLVPSAAIQTQAGQSFARVLKDGRVQQVTVEVGISSDTQTEIISGLSEGDEVITGTASTTSTQQGGTSIFGGFGGGAFRPR